MRAKFFLLCAVNKDHGKVFHTVTVEIARRNVWMIVWHGPPYSTRPGFHLLDIIRAVAVFISSLAILGMPRKPVFKDLMLLGT
jgi:hypothetical protein